MTEWIELIVWVVVIIALLVLFVGTGKRYFKSGGESAEQE